jgi:hypothetical protein
VAERTYTTKSRAKRIQLDYFKHPHPFRRAKLWISIGLAVVAAAAVIGYAIRGDHRLYTSGPVSTAHAMFGTRCADCHAAVAPTAAAGVPSRAAFFVPVSDLTCSLCHEGPTHHQNQTFTPACASCHFEHKSRFRLVDLGDRQCTQCHAGLVSKDGRAPEFTKTIASFDSGHPEFAVDVLRDGRKTRVRLDDKTAPRDGAQIKLNHALHLKAGLGGLDDVRARTGKLGIIDRDGQPALSCSYCHRLDERRVSIKPIAYADHCVDCHPIVSKIVPGAVAPHAGPRIVHACLKMTLEASEQRAVTAKGGTTTAKVNEDCGILRTAVATAAPGAAAQEAEPEAPRGGRLGRTAAAEPEPEAPRGGRLGGRSAPAETSEPEPERPRRGLRGGGEEAKAAPEAPAPAGPAQLARLEKEIFGPGNCGKCHTMTPSSAGLPQVAPTAIPVRWLPHSVFDHGVHRSVTCTECHGKATKSTETADVLLPSVSVCRECHRAAGGARASCVECHLYHDKTEERDPSGPLTVKRMRHGASAVSPSRSQ